MIGGGDGEVHPVHGHVSRFYILGIIYHPYSLNMRIIQQLPRSLQHLSRYGLTGFLTSRPTLPDLLAPRTLHACTVFRRSTKHPEQVRSYFVVTCPSYFFLTIFSSDKISFRIVQSFIVTGGHAGDGVGLYTTEILLPGKNHTSPEWCLFNGFG